MEASARPPRKKRFEPTPDPNDIVVPGVDPSLPPAVQIDMIDQLITARLASIDNNLARAHQVITNEVLPAVQRYARVTQPTRDAARFWRSFFELAAQVRVPTEGDFTQTETENEESRTEEDVTETGISSQDAPSFDRDATIDSTTTSHGEAASSAASFLSDLQQNRARKQHQHPDATPAEHSFAPFLSSTPAREAGDPNLTHDTTGSSAAWTPSHGSVSGGMNPSFNLSSSEEPTPVTGRGEKGRQSPGEPFLPDFSSDSELSVFHPPTPSDTDPSSSADSPVLGAGSKWKGKGKAAGSGNDLRQTVLKKRISKGGGGGGGGGGLATPKLSRYNPFQPGGSTEPWNGLVDLSTSPSLSTGNTSSLPDFAKVDFSGLSISPSRSSGSRERLLPGDSASTYKSGSNEQSDEKLFDWSISNSSIRFPQPHPDLLRLVATPSKKAADLIVQDLLKGVDLSLLEDSPAPPELPTPRSRHKAPQKAAAAGPRPSVLRALKNPLLKDDDDDDDGDLYDDDSFDDDEVAHQDYAPQQPFAGNFAPEDEDDMAGDNSFDSDLSFDDEGAPHGVIVDHGVTDGFGDTDNFDNALGAGGADDSDTLFGPRGNPPPPRHGFQLENDNSMHTFMHGGRLEDAAPFQPSPTPFTGAFEPLHRRQQK